MTELEQIQNLVFLEKTILNPSETFCPTCHGKGVYVETKKDSEYYSFSICYQCKGTGKLDWIQRATNLKKIGDKNENET